MIEKLNRRVSILQPTTAISGSGDATITYASVGEFWANVKQISSKALLMQGKENINGMYEITLRYQSINIQQVLQYEGKRLFIKGITEKSENNKRFVQIIASEHQ